MTRRQVVWARSARQRLRMALGGECAVCGSTEGLEFDCIVPQGPAHHRTGVIGRTCFYRKQHAVGNLQLLCPACHAPKSAAEYHASLIDASQQVAIDKPF